MVSRYRRYSYQNVAQYKKGWRGDSEGHRLAAMGISLGRAKRPSPFISPISQIPTVEDIPTVDIPTPAQEAPLVEKSAEGAEQQAQPVEGEPSPDGEGTLPLSTPGTPPEPKHIEDERHEYEW